MPSLLPPLPPPSWLVRKTLDTVAGTDSVRVWDEVEVGRELVRVDGGDVKELVRVWDEVGRELVRVWREAGTVLVCFGSR